MMTRRSIFPIGLATTDRIEPVPHVSHGGIDTLLPIVLGNGQGLLRPRARHFLLDHFGIAVVGLFESARPAIYHPAIVFQHGFGVIGQAITQRDTALSAKNLEAALRRAL